MNTLARLWHARVQITVRHTDASGATWESSRQVPTFVIDTSVTGDRNIEQVERSARNVIMTADMMGHIVGCAVSVSPLYISLEHDYR